MNCLEVHRILSSEPTNRSHELVVHLDGCTACARHASQVDHFERQLADTFDVSTPDNLEHRILIAQSLGASHHKHKRNRHILTIAASLLLTFTLAGSLFYTDATTTVDKIALQHVNDELHHLLDHKNVSLSKLNDVLNPHRMKLNSKIGTINYAAACQFKNTKGVHVVLQGERAPVTLLVMPGKYIKHQQNINDDRFQGILIPMEQGSVAIIGENKEDLIFIEAQFKQALEVIKSDPLTPSPPEKPSWM